MPLSFTTHMFSYQVHIHLFKRSSLQQLQYFQMQEVIVIKESLSSQPDYTGQIKITVLAPQLNQTEPFSYFTYNITGKDMHGEFSVRRRYSDFDLLRKRLTQRWLGIYLTPISGKRAQNNPLYVLKVFEPNNAKSEVKYAQTRRRFLRYFCQGIALRPYIFYCDLFQIFLRGPPDFELAISNCISKEYSFILNAYENSFKLLIASTEQTDFNAMLAVNQSHLEQLKKSQDKLLTICNQIFRTVDAKEEFNNQFNLCMGTALPDYQERFLLNHVGKDRTKLIINRDQKFANKLTQLKEVTVNNPLELFLQLVMYQIRQTKAFIEAIEDRKQAEKRKIQLRQKIESKQIDRNKLTNGGFSFRALFKTGSKELQLNQLEMKIEILKNQLSCIEKMIVIMVANTNYQIQQYRLRRSKEYVELFKNVAKREIIELGLYNQLLQMAQGAIN